MSKLKNAFGFNINLFTLLLCSLIAIQLDAQNTDEPPYVEGELIVRLEKDQAIEPILRKLSALNGEATRVKVVRQLSRNLNVWQIKFDDSAFNNQDMLSAFQNQANVMVAQNNHYITLRDSVPNDPQYEDQWQYDNNGENGGTVGADIDAPEAWEITTGGLTPIGDTIVVCVIDDGLDLDHEDFGNNIWYNWAEIPSNGIDDDNNGYVDDYLGWNISSDNDNISGGFLGGGHGTPVTGIVGAKGNNEVGVAGVNWNVKLMIVAASGISEAEAIAAYEYPLTQRIRYNETNGSEGAFVVATNSSWGIDFLSWEDAPIWCSFYDSLGAAGILNPGATINGNVDVDVAGDMPTSCPSDFMISVTNLNRTGNKEFFAGFGLTTIDLGAYGADTWTTASNNSYAGFGGTSGATPHVTGAIGLLYSAPCLGFAALARTDPEGAALMVREAILSSVVPNPDLDGITVTGGTLNLKNALDSLLNTQCDFEGCYEPFALQLGEVGSTEADLSWWGSDSASSHVVSYRELGEEIWNTFSVADTFTTITGLTQCTIYEVEVLSDCDTTMSGSSNIVNFTTGDCCLAPANITVSSNSENTLNLSWDENTEAQQYYVEYRMAGTEEWVLDSSLTADFQISGLLSCTEYEVRLLSNCNLNINNEYSPITNIKTIGCGACEDLSYCDINGGDASSEWITNVTLETLNNSSESDEGYFDFSALVEAPSLLQGYEYPISLSLERSSPSSVEWRVWIDFDQDGDFILDELVLVQGGFTDEVHEDVIPIALDAIPGITRMRVSMKFQGNGEPCGSFTFGEVEDYCVNIVSTLGFEASPKTDLMGIKAYPNPTKDQLNIEIYHNEQAAAYIELLNAKGQKLIQKNIILSQGQNYYQLDLEQMPKGIYLLRLLTDKGAIKSIPLIKK